MYILVVCQVIVNLALAGSGRLGRNFQFSHCLSYHVGILTCGPSDVHGVMIGILTISCLCILTLIDI